MNVKENAIKTPCMVKQFIIHYEVPCLIVFVLKKKEKKKTNMTSWVTKTEGNIAFPFFFVKI